ncbi:hypothetical protein AB0N99_30605 [Streptomyces sp. NPDC093272]|uniref:hypothetical protein n=1 Tax=Streptomyces sp. NPDC093272 TaxID=3154981 RepID=UPI00342706B0
MTDPTAYSVLMHFTAEAHRRKWSYDRGLDDDGVPIKSEAFNALHRLGEEMNTALGKLDAARRAAPASPSVVSVRALHDRAAEAPAVWVDGHPQLEAIAAAVWEQCRTEGTSLVVDDPRNIAVAAYSAVVGVLAADTQTGDRAAVSAALWAAAEHHTIAEWICCDPITPDHDLCVKGDATLHMLRALLVDDPEDPRPAPLLAEVMRYVAPGGSVLEAHRLALSQAVDLGTGAPWDAIHERVAELNSRSDVGTEFVRQADHPDQAGLAAFEADLAETLTDAMIALHAESGVDTPGCDCGHNGMGPKWHARACAWLATMTVPHPDAAAETQQTQTETHSCHNCERINPDSCLMNPRRRQNPGALERVRRLHDQLAEETDLASPDDLITRGAAAKRIAAALDGWNPTGAPSCDVEFERGGRCAKPAGHRPPGSDDPHVPELPAAVPAVPVEATTDNEETLRTVCVCGHTKGEHIAVSGRLLCDSCDPDSTDNLVCRGFDAL